jgi:TPR repeat protein
MGDLGAVIFQNQAEGHRWSVNARKGNSMSPMPLHTLVCALVVAVWSSAGNAATFELARRADGIIIQGVKVEGDIVPGDAKKLLDFYMTYGVTTSPVHLRSKGGNVEEAMKMGAIIRRLRLETEVPVWDTGRQPIDAVKVDHQENTICASACFLVYAGGASRFGNYVAMHRPFFPREEARKLSDVEYEAAQKKMVPKVKAYLADMDIDQYWIDRMFSANSQEHYMPTWNEADSKVHHLMGVVPSLEEVILSKCREDPDVDRKLREFHNASRKPLSADDQTKIKEIMQDSDVFFQCKKMVLSDMQSAAFERENDALLNEKCKQFPPLTPSEMTTLKAFFQKGASVTPEEDGIRTQLFGRADSYNQCRSRENYALGFAAYKKWSDEFEASKRTARLQTADDFDAKGLSAEAMAKKGKEAYDAESYDAAMRWFRKAADVGNTEAMMGMSWIYGNGRGVPQDDAEALRWRKMSAEHGNAVAMWVVGVNYEEGKVVPQDYAEAMRWYKKSADLGDADAMERIGSLYSYGRGMPQDYAEAMRWLKKAADLGNTTAMFVVGVFYQFGEGVPKDEAQARVWMKKAAAMGNIAANMWLRDNPATESR